MNEKKQSMYIIHIQPEAAKEETEKEHNRKHKRAHTHTNTSLFRVVFIPFAHSRSNFLWIREMHESSGRAKRKYMRWVYVRLSVCLSPCTSSTRPKRYTIWWVESVVWCARCVLTAFYSIRQHILSVSVLWPKWKGSRQHTTHILSLPFQHQQHPT